MQLKNYNVYFFFALLLAVSILAFFIVKPFLTSFLMAAVLASFFNFAYKKIKQWTGGREVLSSFLTCVAVALVILIPILFIASLLANEIYDLVTQTSVDTAGISKIIGAVNERLGQTPLLENLDWNSLFSQERALTLVKSFSQNALLIIQKTYQGVAHFAFVVAVMFFSLFFLFIDGEKLLGKITSLSPLKNKYEDILVKKFNSIARATLKGTTLVAIVQGFLSAILFWVTGVYSPVTLGIISAVSSVIPSVGTALVWLPAGVLMIILGNVWQGIIILLVGFLVIGMVDNILKPKLVGKDTQMHPLLVFFSTLGGITLFGASGFIVGPIIISFFLVLWEIYGQEFKEQLQEYNE